jgi:hypothetical protein
MAYDGVLTSVRQPLTISAILILVACGSAPAASAPGATAPGASASTTTVTSSASPSATRSPSPAGVGPCQLPVEVSGSPPQVGWLSLPSGQFLPDSSAKAGMSPSGDVAWDSGAGTWLPTQPWMISPDGSNYIPQDATIIQIADARTGTVLRTVPPGDYNIVFAYMASGIYAEHIGMNTIPGLWRIDPSTGSVTQLQTSSDSVEWAIVDVNAAWGTHTTADNVTTIERLDFSTGVITDINQPPGQDSVALVGSVGSGVLVTLAGAHFGMVSAMLVNPDGSMASVDVPPALLGKPFSPLGHLQDGPFVFFSGLGFGLAAYDQDHGFRVLTGAPQDMFLLGKCRPN